MSDWSFSSSPPIVTQEQFTAFHTIDRALFTCLVVELNYRFVDAINIMALLLWLERHGNEPDLVARISKFPFGIIDIVARECFWIRLCLESEIFPGELEGKNGLIDTIVHLTKCSRIDLHFFHHHRHNILPSVEKIRQLECLWAFADIDFPLPSDMSHGNESTTSRSSIPSTMGESPSNVSRAQLGGMAPQMIGIPQTQTHVSERVNREPNDDIGNYSESLNNNMTEVQEQFHNLVIKADHEDEQEEPYVHPDDRTIFIIFSRGYSVSESELRDYITRKFGNIIETIYMQDVTASELQPLYAGVVVRSEKMTSAVLGGLLKVKFTINGKHVWARKYVVQASKSAEESSTSTSKTV